MVSLKHKKKKKTQVLLGFDGTAGLCVPARLTEYMVGAR